MQFAELSKLYDYTIIGGGIVGVSTALQLKRRLPDCSVRVIEKAPAVAQHQTGHNSGVIHAGVYYQPGSLKADFCKRGARAIMDFCRQYHIPFAQCGKLLVATDPVELERMAALQQRCRQNAIDVTELDQRQLRELEPNITGLAALSVAQSGIADFQQITKTMARLVQGLGGVISTNTELLDAQEDNDCVILETNRGTIKTRYAISCSGLMADRVTRMLGISNDFAIIPFRGEYYRLSAQKSDIVKRLIYPIPDPAMPFLGVHLTPTINGGITVGPNAVLGWKREGYSRINFKFTDTIEMLRFPGFWRLAKQHIRAGLSEFKNSCYKKGFLRLIQRYCPELQLDDLQPHRAGIRAQAVLRDGSLVHDFLFAESARSLHVCNAPSPAATSAIPIGEYIVNRIIDKTANKK